jgi:hypothetical protein
MPENAPRAICRHLGDLLLPHDISTESKTQPDGDFFETTGGKDENCCITLQGTSDNFSDI